VELKMNVYEARSITKESSKNIDITQYVEIIDARIRTAAKSGLCSIENAQRNNVPFFSIPDNEILVVEKHYQEAGFTWSWVRYKDSKNITYWCAKLSW
jgi:hypothetical protein